jgi:EmrB/QacA subfamily drug resistance transporter
MATATTSEIDASADTRSEGLSRELIVLGAVFVLGAIMTVLDLTIVNVAVPTIGRELGASISAIQWVMTGYMLAFASVIPLAGWASERFGAKRVWLVSLVVFMLGSVLAGAAWSTESLIVCRVLQGLGAGLILPVGQTILAQAAGPQRMGRVMSLVGVPMLLGPILGNVIGGAIVDQVSWHWIFYINVPVGVLAVVAAHRLLPEARPQLGQQLDLRGLALLSPGIALFLYAMTEAANNAGFHSTGTLAAAAAGLALVALFVWHASRRGKTALIDLSLFRRRGFATASALNFLLIAALFGSLLLLPLYYELVRQASPLNVGLLLVPQGVGAALAMPLAGRLTDKIGARIVVSVGIVVAALGTLAYAQVGARTSYLYLAWALFVVGLGIGSMIVPSMAAAFKTLAREETPRATSALNTIQRIGGAIGSALLTIILQRAIAANIPDFEGGIQGMVALSRQPHAAPLLAHAFGSTFWIAVGLIAAGLVPALLLPGARAQREAEESTSPPHTPPKSSIPRVLLRSEETGGQISVIQSETPPTLDQQGSAKGARDDHP